MQKLQVGVIKKDEANMDKLRKEFEVQKANLIALSKELKAYEEKDLVKKIGFNNNRDREEPQTPDSTNSRSSDKLARTEKIFEAEEKRIEELSAQRKKLEEEISKLGAERDQLVKPTMVKGKSFDFTKQKEESKDIMKLEMELLRKSNTQLLSEKSKLEALVESFKKATRTRPQSSQSRGESSSSRGNEKLISEYKTQISNHEKNEVSLRKSVKDLESTINIRNNELLQLKKKKVISSNTTKAKIVESIKKTEKNIMGKYAEIDSSLAGQLEAFDGLQNTIAQKLIEFENALSNAFQLNEKSKEESEAKSKKITELEQKLITSRNLVLQQSSTNQTLKSNIGNLDKENKNLKALIDKANSDLKIKTKELEDKQKEAVSNTQKMASQIINKDTAIKQCNAKIEELKISLNEMKMQLDSEIENRKKAEESSRIAEENCAKLNLELEESSKNLELQNTIVEDLRGKLAPENELAVERASRENQRNREEEEEDEDAKNNEKEKEKEEPRLYLETMKCKNMVFYSDIKKIFAVNWSKLENKFNNVTELIDTLKLTQRNLKEKYESDTKNKDARIEQLMSQLDENIEEQKKFSTSSTTLANELQQKDNIIDELKEEIKREKENCEGSKKRLREDLERIKQLVESNIHAAIDENASKVESLELTVAKLWDAFNKLKNNKDEIAKEYEREIEKSNEKYSNLRRQYKDSISKVKLSISQLMKLLPQIIEKKIQKDIGVFSQLVNQISSIHKRIQVLKQQNAEQDKEIKAKNAAITQSKKQLEDSLRMNDLVQEKIAAKNDEINKLKADAQRFSAIEGGISESNKLIATLQASSREQEGKTKMIIEQNNKLIEQHKTTIRKLVNHVKNFEAKLNLKISEIFTSFLRFNQKHLALDDVVRDMHKLAQMKNEKISQLNQQIEQEAKLIEENESLKAIFNKSKKEKEQIRERLTTFKSMHNTRMDGIMSESDKKLKVMLVSVESSHDKVKELNQERNQTIKILQEDIAFQEDAANARESQIEEFLVQVQQFASILSARADKIEERIAMEITRIQDLLVSKCFRKLAALGKKLRSKNETLKNRIQELETNLAVKSAMDSNKQKQTASMEEIVRALQEKNVKLQKQYQEIKEKHDQVQEENDQMIKERMLACNLMAENKAAISKYEAGFKDLTEQITLYKEDFIQLAEIIGKHEEEYLLMTEQKISEVKSVVRTIADKHNKQIKQIKGKHLEEKEAIQTLLKETENKLKKKQEELDSMKEKYEILTNDHRNELNKKIEELEVAIKQINKEKVEAYKKLRDVKEYINKNKEMIFVSFQERVAEINSKIENVQTKVINCSDSLSELSESQRARKQQISSDVTLSTKVSELIKTAFENMEGQIKIHEEKIGNTTLGFQAKISKCYDQIKTLQLSVQGQKNQAKIVELEEELKKLTQVLDQKEDVFKVALEKVNEENKNLKETKEAREKEIAELNEKLKKLDIECKNFKQCSCDLQDKLTKLMLKQQEEEQKDEVNSKESYGSEKKKAPDLVRGIAKQLVNKEMRGAEGSPQQDAKTVINFGARKNSNSSINTCPLPQRETPMKEKTSEEMEKKMSEHIKSVLLKFLAGVPLG